MEIQLAPTTAGAPFTAAEWTAEVGICGTDQPWRYSDLTVTAGSRADALSEIKRRARALGYRGTFHAYTDAWRHF